MTVMQNPTLSQMKETLAHAVAEERTASTKREVKGRGKGGFDESKVKRDGDGQFAKKDARQLAKDDEIADLMWLENTAVIQEELLDQLRPEINKMAEDLAKKRGIDLEDLEAHPDVVAELNTSTLKKLNDVAASTPGGVSPSGKQQLRFESVKSSPDSKYPDKLVNKVVYRGGAPLDRKTYIGAIEANRTIYNVRRGAAREASKGDDTPMFNPDANIEGGRVTDIPTNSSTGTSAEEKSKWEKFKDLFHSDLAGDEFSLVFDIEGDSPTSSEMAHILEVQDALAHYGIKGMKWGIRRSDRQLAALRDEDGEEIGGIRTRSGADARTLKKMSAGQAVVIEDSDGSGAPMAVVKLKDGSFKKVHVSADAQAAVRTMNKEQVEMSTRELKEAAARAKAIEDYNKYFGPKEDKPNAELQAAVDRLELEQKYAKAYASMNPTKIERASNFISKAAPIYDTYVKLNKTSNGQLAVGLSEFVDMMRSQQSSGKHAKTRTEVAQEQAAKMVRDKAEKAEKAKKKAQK